MTDSALAAWLTNPHVRPAEHPLHRPGELPCRVCGIRRPGCEAGGCPTRIEPRMVPRWPVSGPPPTLPLPEPGMGHGGQSDPAAADGARPEAAPRPATDPLQPRAEEAPAISLANDPQLGRQPRVTRFDELPSGGGPAPVTPRPGAGVGEHAQSGPPVVAQRVEGPRTHHPLPAAGGASSGASRGTPPPSAPAGPAVEPRTGSGRADFSALWRHQREAIDFALARKGALLAIPMGSGKSRCAVEVAVRSGAGTVSVLCPVSVIGVWRREFAKHAPPDMFDVLCLDGGTCTEKAKRLAEAAALAQARKRRLVVVCNYESAWRPGLRQAFLNRLWDLLILDESHRAKAPGGKTSRFAAELGKRCKRRLALTGTPMPHSPLDIFGQARALDPAVFGWSFTAFRGRYAFTDPKFPGRVLKWLNQDELRERIDRFTYRCSLDGVLDLPPVTEQVIEVELGAKARKAYDALEAEFWTQVESGEITVSNALVKLLRLAQITGGAVPLDDGTLSRIDDAKRRALADLLEDVPPDVPVAVFCRFRADLDAVRESAAAAGRSYGEISGTNKDALDEHACLREGVRLVGVQIQSGGVGIDLSRASVGVWYSLGFSLGEYLQSRARLDRPGQTRHVSFFNLVARNTVDEAIYAALERRQEVVDAILSGKRQERAAA